MRFSKLSDDIFTVGDFFTRQECLEAIVQREGLGFELAKVNTAGGSRVHTDVRNNSRAFYRSEELAEYLWQRVQPFAPAQVGNSHPVGLNELFRTEPAA